MQTVGIVLLVTSAGLFFLPCVCEMRFVKGLRKSPMSHLRILGILWILLTTSVFMAGMNLSGAMDLLDNAMAETFPARCPR